MPTKLIDFNKTVIYKIVCNDASVTDIYIGSTTDFTTRKSSHKYKCNNPNIEQFGYKVYQSIRKNGGWDNWTMVEIEKFPCNDGNEARARERYWYELFNASLNSQKPIKTEEDFRQEKHQHYFENKAKINEYTKQHYIDNKTQYLERAKKRYDDNKEKLKKEISKRSNIKKTCECGSIVNQYTLNRHMLSLKHLAYDATQQCKL